MIRLTTISVVIVISVLAVGAATMAMNAGQSQGGGSLEKPATGRDLVSHALQLTRQSAGTVNGLYLDQRYHIALVPRLQKVSDVLDANYATKIFDDLERDVNHAAERLIPVAVDYVGGSTSRTAPNETPVARAADDRAVTDDPVPGNNAALRAALQPLVHDRLVESGAYDALRTVQQRYEAASGLPFPKFDLAAFTVDKTIDAFRQNLRDQKTRLQTSPSLWLSSAPSPARP